MKNWKLISLAILLFITVVCILTALHFKNKYENAGSITAGVKQDIQTEATIIARKVDRSGFQHVTIEAAKNIIPLKDK